MTKNYKIYDISKLLGKIKLHRNPQIHMVEVGILFIQSSDSSIKKLLSL